MRNFSKVLLGVLVLSWSPFAFANSLDDVSGLWLNDNKSGHINIEDCGDGTPCGTLVWVELSEDGANGMDRHNPDKTLATRPLVGVQLLYGFKLKSDKWKSGKIYNPKDGKTYGSSIKRLEDGTLQVKGCIGPICKKQIWTKIDTPALVQTP